MHWASIPWAPAWRCTALRGPLFVAGSTGGAAVDAAGKAARVDGVLGVRVVKAGCHLVLAFIKREEDGDFFIGTGSGSGVFFMAKVTLFYLSIYPGSGYLPWWVSRKLLAGSVYKEIHSL